MGHQRGTVLCGIPGEHMNESRERSCQSAFWQEFHSLIWGKREQVTFLGRVTFRGCYQVGENFQPISKIRTIVGDRLWNPRFHTNNALADCWLAKTQGHQLKLSLLRCVKTGRTSSQNLIEPAISSKALSRFHDSTSRQPQAEKHEYTIHIHDFRNPPARRGVSSSWSHNSPREAADDTIFCDGLAL